MNGIRDDDPRLAMRIVVAREFRADNTETLTFRCGHSVVAVIPGLAGVRVPCAECISELLKEYKAARETQNSGQSSPAGGRAAKDFVFTPPKYDQEYCDAMAKMDSSLNSRLVLDSDNADNGQREGIDKLRCAVCRKALAIISLYIQPKDSIRVLCDECQDDNGQREGSLNHLTTELIQMAEDYRLAANSVAYEDIAGERAKLGARIYFALKERATEWPAYSTIRYPDPR